MRLLRNVLNNRVCVFLISLSISIPAWLAAVVSNHHSLDFGIVLRMLILSAGACVAGTAFLLYLVLEKVKLGSALLIVVILCSLSHWVLCNAVDRVFVEF